MDDNCMLKYNNGFNKYFLGASCGVAVEWGAGQGKARPSGAYCPVGQLDSIRKLCSNTQRIETDHLQRRRL